MRKNLFLLLIFMLVTVGAFAVPAKPGLKRVLTLSDGTKVEAQLIGDEHGHFWQSSDGRTFMRRQAVDIYDETNVEPLKALARERRMKANEQRAARMPGKRGVGDFREYFGKKRGLIILVNFSNLRFENSHNQALYERIANEKNFYYGDFKGSMYDYFYAQSEGQFELLFDVVGPVTVSNTQAYYGGNDRNGNDLHPGEMAREACELADPYVDFSDYDWDGDGEVDQVYIVYAGKGEADGGAATTIWPHAWDLRSATGRALTLDGMRVNTYACGGELDGQTSRIGGIGVMCHEFSHCLGYPDFYDIDYSGGQGMGYWDLMDSGSYNGGGYQPAGYTSYERWVAGWKTPTELISDQTIEGMQSLQEGGDSYVIYNDGHRNEYFLLENRRHVGWDESIPGEGLLIIHVDYSHSSWSNNSPNNSPSHQRMTWIPADGTYQNQTYSGSKYYSFSGMSTDTYPYGSNNSFGNETTPAATLYNKNVDGSKLLNKLVYDIRKHSDGTVSFAFQNNNGNWGPIEPTGSGDYVRITQSSQISADNAYLLVYEQSEEEALVYSGISENYGQAVSLPIDGYTLNNPDSLAHELTFQPADNGEWYIKDGDAYLGYNGRSSTLVLSPEPASFGFTWQITQEAILNGDYLLGRLQIQFNPDNSKQSFGCYSGKQKSVILYVKTKADLPEPQEAELAFSPEEVTVEEGTTTFSQPLLLNPHDLPVVYASSNDQLATVDAATGQVTLGEGTGRVIISATFDGNDLFLEQSVSYAINIIAKQDVAIRQIENGELKMVNSPVYDLSGRQIVNSKSVNRKYPKGLYIRGGKKIIVNP